jgi:predicted ATPase/DNA-binding winged helix-turn-helix (wHTH) protein
VWRQLEEGSSLLEADRTQLQQLMLNLMINTMHAPNESILPTEPMLEECYEFASFRLFPKRRMLLRVGERVAIGGRALDLLLLLVSQAGKVVSFDDLMRLVWPNVTVQEANVRVQMVILRKVLSQCDEAKGAIDTVPNRGYCFVLSVRHHPDRAAADGSSLRRQPALPMMLNPTVGRDGAIQTIENALDNHRLVTITGPGGIGKTTVAIATAQSFAKKSQAIIRFVDLSHVADGAGAAQAISEVFPLPPDGGGLEALCEHLRTREALLILDTCEHIVDTVATLAELILSHCSNLKLLVTSQEALRARGEWIHRLPSLTFPAEGAKIEQKDIAKFSAISLLVDRIQSSTRFKPHGRDLPAISEICRKLDGIPLALEFAAARVPELGLREIAARLDDCFAILTRGRRTALSRHRTLEAAFAWSYDLLSEDEQRMLAHLAALRGCFSADHAIASCLDGACKRPCEAFYGLLDKSFLAVEMAVDEPKFRLLETTRVYAVGVACSQRFSERPLVRSALTRG